MSTEFTVKTNRSGAAGFYLHVGADDVALVSALRDAAVLYDRPELAEQIDGFVQLFGLDLTPAIAEAQADEQADAPADVPSEDAPPKGKKKK